MTGQCRCQASLRGQWCLQLSTWLCSQSWFHPRAPVGSAAPTSQTPDFQQSSPCLSPRSPRNKSNWVFHKGDVIGTGLHDILEPVTVTRKPVLDWLRPGARALSPEQRVKLQSAVHLPKRKPDGLTLGRGNRCGVARYMFWVTSQASLPSLKSTCHSLLCREGVGPGGHVCVT